MKGLFSLDGVVEKITWQQFKSCFSLFLYKSGSGTSKPIKFAN